MQVDPDMKCMETNFGGRGISGFGVMAPFSLPSKQRTIVHGGQKIELAQKIHISRD